MATHLHPLRPPRPPNILLLTASIGAHRLRADEAIGLALKRFVPETQATPAACK